MEVHAHTHTPPASGGTGRKKWTHYLWEFLMLFLAVFAGFLAENQREHFVEHQREKQFVRALMILARFAVSALISLNRDRTNCFSR